MRINPSWRVSWPDEHTVRVGSGPEALVLADVAPPLRPWLERLAREGLSDASLAGAPEELRALVGRLAPALMEDAEEGAAAHAVPGLAGDRLRSDAHAWASAYGPGVGRVLQRRHRAHVWISGLDRCGLSLALELAAAGVGRLSVRDRGKLEPGDLGGTPLRLTELGLPRSAALARHVGRLYPHTHVLAPVALHDAVRGIDLAVLVCRDGLAARDVARLSAAGVAALPIVFHESGFSVGPLHLPEAPGCAACRWEAWPLAEEPSAAADGSPKTSPQPEEAPETTSALLAAALAAQSVVMVLDDVNLPSLVEGRYVCTLGSAAVHFEPLPATCGHRLAA